MAPWPRVWRSCRRIGQSARWPRQKRRRLPKKRTQPYIGPERDTTTNILGKVRGAVAKVRRRPLVLAGLVGGLVLLLTIVLMIGHHHGGPATEY